MNLLRLLLFSLLAASAVFAQKKRPDPTAADVRYGPFDRNLLDFWQAPGSSATNPAPLVIYYHGGGWLAGDKKKYNPSMWLGQGISVASVNYRFTVGTKDAAPYPAPMEDGARALQFLRSKAGEWHLDADKVALTGSSAGAVMSMWIAYRDDMAKPESTDPVERISTRVTCVLPTSTPTNLDPAVILKRIGGSPKIHPAFLPFFDVKSIAELNEPDKAALLKDANPFSHLSKDDPPTYTFFPMPLTKTPLPEDTNVNLSIHHPEFGVMLKEALDAHGVEAHVQYKGDGKKPTDFALFVVRHLKGESPKP